MNQYRKLLNNSLIFAVGNLGSKVITFLMLPLYTYALSTSEYGIVDLMLTTTSLLLPIVGLSIFDSVLRFSMDKENDLRGVFSNGMYVTILSSIVLLVSVPIIAMYKVEMIFLPLLLIIQLFQNLFAQYAKAINKVKIFAMNGILLSFLTAGLNIFFLVVLKMGLVGYLVSLLIANLLSSLYLAIRLKVSNVFEWKKINKADLVTQLRFSIPLIPNSIAWWITTAVGRYFILLFLGTAANGIFAVANKVPTLLTVFTSIFSQSWQISAIEGYESDDKSDTLNKVYTFYFSLLFIGSSLLIVFLKPIMQVLVSSDFFEAWEYVPFLLLTVIFSSSSGFLGAQYIAMKDTVGVFKTTVIGSILNIALNFALIPLMGLQGVGMGSFLSFFVVWLIRHVTISKKYELNIKMFKIYAATILIFAQSLIAIYSTGVLNVLLQIIILSVITFIYRASVLTIYSIMSTRIVKKFGK